MNLKRLAITQEVGGRADVHERRHRVRPARGALLSRVDHHLSRAESEVPFPLLPIAQTACTDEVLAIRRSGGQAMIGNDSKHILSLPPSHSLSLSHAMQCTSCRFLSEMFSNRRHPFWQTGFLSTKFCTWASKSATPIGPL